MARVVVIVRHVPRSASNVRWRVSAFRRTGFGRSRDEATDDLVHKLGNDTKRTARAVAGHDIRALAERAAMAEFSYAAVRKAITDSYYDCRNAGETMETAADLAATRVMNLFSQALSPVNRAEQCELPACIVAKPHTHQIFDVVAPSGVGGTDG